MIFCLSEISVIRSEDKSFKMLESVISIFILIFMCFSLWSLEIRLEFNKIARLFFYSTILHADSRIYCLFSTCWCLLWPLIRVIDPFFLNLYIKAFADAYLICNNFEAFLTLIFSLKTNSSNYYRIELVITSYSFLFYVLLI